jgi:L-2,4-diaminobutyric acid acetyltransferase
MRSAAVLYRAPRIEDGTSIWKLVRDSGALDLNSPYCYLLLCLHYRETCAVAEAEGKIVGFVSAYPPPARGDTLFIWQIGIDPALRGKGLATRLLGELLQREACSRIRYLEATVGPSNRASRALFEGFAKRLNTNISEQACFDETVFPDHDHESENLFRIGPFSPPQTV